nr:esterase-like activity of phytase family protein [Gammaproteobacteria bacterium]
MKSFRKLVLTLSISSILGLCASVQADEDDDQPSLQFERIATFPVFLNTDVELETVAEIIDATSDGHTLIYTDSETDNIGFINIEDPAQPQADGIVAVGGEPTSVAVSGKYALVAVNTSADFVNTSGYLQVIDIEDRDIVTSLDLDGQPDSVAVSPDGRYAAVVIENERDEDLFVDGVEGGLPQLPSGFLQIVDLHGHPLNWTTRVVDLTGLAEIAPSDAEAEYVDINRRNLAAVTLQENNHIVYVNLHNGRVTSHYSAGDVDLTDIDIIEEDVIKLTGSLEDVKREPDAITWIGNNYTATANEGDFEGGSRGFSIFHRKSGLQWDAGNSYEHIAVRHGHYPESRSENKGAEPEGIEYARYGKKKYLFVGSERGNFVAVYRLHGIKQQEFVQVLPVTNGPEGLKAIPERRLFVVSSEVDDAAEGIRSTVSIFRLRKGQASYPTIVSDEDPVNEDIPIAWGALSGMVGDIDEEETLYTVHDSYYKEPRIYTIDTEERPAEIEDVTVLQGGPSNCPTDCNYDPEGIAQAKDGSFWIASEGNSSRDNLLIRVDEDGNVMEEVALPASVQQQKINNGFEGVAMAEN